MSVMIKIMLSSIIVSFGLAIISGLISDFTISDWLEKVMEALSGFFLTALGISTIGFFLTLIWRW